MDENRAADAQGDAATSKLGWVLLALALVIAGAAIGWRMMPHGDSQPAATPADSPAPPSIEELKARAEKDPKDSKAWTDLAFAYFSSGSFADAASAYRQAAEGDPGNAALWSALGEARVLSSDKDPMPPGAVSAFEKAIALDPTDPRARYFLAVKKDLSGDHKGAIADWLALLKDTPPGAPWEADLRRTIEQVGKINKIDTSAMLAKAAGDQPAPPPAPAMPQLTGGDAIPGPTQAQIDQARKMRPGEQEDMARGMVDSLEGKLRANPGNVDGWVMLMRSRMTLGEPAKASSALKQALAANPAAADRLRKEAELLGVPQ